MQPVLELSGDAQIRRNGRIPQAGIARRGMTKAGVTKPGIASAESAPAGDALAVPQGQGDAT